MVEGVIIEAVKTAGTSDTTMMEVSIEVDTTREEEMASGTTITGMVVGVAAVTTVVVEATETAIGTTTRPKVVGTTEAGETIGTRIVAVEAQPLTTRNRQVTLTKTEPMPRSRARMRKPKSDNSLAW